MAYEAKDGDVSLFKNTKKTEDKHPDYTGRALVNGQTMYLSMWLKKRDTGEVFFSGRIEPPKERQSEPVDDPFNPPAGQAKSQQPAQKQADDDLPF